MQAAGLNSLNHGIISTQPYPKFPKSGPTVSRSISVRPHP